MKLNIYRDGAVRELSVPDDFSFEMKKTNPFFSDDGEQSLPVTLPPSAENLAALGNPERLGGQYADLRKTAARVTSGFVQKTGQLIIESIGPDGITAALALTESDLYAKSKDKSIREVFGNESYTHTGCNDVQSWAIYLGAVADGTYQAPFTVMPAFTDRNTSGSTDTVVVLNEPDPDDSTAALLTTLRWRMHYIQIGSEKEAVPDGYGITPFLYLHSFIDKLFECLDYTVDLNPFRSSDYSGIVLLNRNADTICKGDAIYYRDIVPSCTVAEFVDWLENKFHVTVLVDTAARKVDVISMESILNTAPSMDVSGIVDGHPKITIGEESHVVLSSDTSAIDGVKPPEETLMDYQKKYPILTEMNETDFAQAASSSSYSIIKRLATGEFYIRKYNKMTQSSKLEPIGSDMFKYDRRANDSAEEFEADDEVPAMMFRELTSGLGRTFVLFGPYVGNRRHSATSIKGKDEDSEEQAIMIAFKGQSVLRTAHGSGSLTDNNFLYRFCTTHKYDDRGLEWNTWNLTPEDIYTKFWARYNKYLLNNNVTVEMTAGFSPLQLHSLRMSDIVRYKGIPMLPKELNYTLGKEMTAGSGTYMALKDGNISEPAAPTFDAQSLEWIFASNIETVVAQKEAEVGMNALSYGFDDEETDAWEYIPPPTRFLQETSKFKRKVVIVFPLGTANTEADCWYMGVYLT